ncbi:MAG: hypothetical protein ACYC1Q_01660 [Bacteroidia bacterium]
MQKKYVFYGKSVAIFATFKIRVANIATGEVQKGVENGENIENIRIKDYKSDV